MISLKTLFWIFLIFFTIIGALRGWAKELIASAGLVLSIFTLKSFGWTIVEALGTTVDPTLAIDANIVYRRQFWIFVGIHLFIAFFSYQGPRFAGGAGGKLAARDTIQDKLLGGILGALNGYLIVGTIIAFLEYRIQPEGFVRLAQGLGYPFPADIITRPIDAFNWAMFSYLPIDFLGGPLLPLLMVALFLVVIIVII